MVYLPGKLYGLASGFAIWKAGLVDVAIGREGCMGWPLVLLPGRPGWLIMSLAWKAARLHVQTDVFVTCKAARAG
jgi:hypothetical protein